MIATKREVGKIKRLLDLLEKNHTLDQLPALFRSMESATQSIRSIKARVQKAASVAAPRNGG